MTRSTLIQSIHALHGIECPCALMDLLQDQGSVSDEAVLLDDVATEDLEAIVKR